VDGWQIAALITSIAALVAGSVLAGGGWGVFLACAALLFFVFLPHWLWTWPMSHRLVLRPRPCCFVQTLRLHW